MTAGKLMTSRTYSGTYPGLETPPGGVDNDGPSVGYPKGWSSERVPPSHRTRRPSGPAGLIPLSSGRTLPSKWEDAERWICSPVSVGNVSTNSNDCYYVCRGGPRTGSHLAQYQRRAKSKSGPLGPSGPVFYSGGYNSFSPVLGMGVINGGRWRNSLTIEPSGLASARFEDRLGVGGGGASSEGGRKSCPGDAAWLDSWSGPGSPTQDELNINEAIPNNLEQEEENYNNDDNQVVNGAISRRDMATETYPESQSSTPSSAISSPKSSISTTSPSPLLFKVPENDVQSQEYEVRDVQVDKQASGTRTCLGGNYVNVGGCDQSVSSSTASVIEADSKISKFQREEARISAWENLQKAKAEAAIQKLEEKLEKKRASSMDKIIQKLRRAEIKAQKMRSTMSSGDNHEHESRAVIKTTSKIPSFCKKIRLNSSIRSCYTCYPF